MKSVSTLFASAALTAILAATAHAQDLLIKDATIITNTNAGRITDGDVLIRDGKITRIAQDITGAPGVETMDGSGKWVTPGLFAPFSRLGLVEISLESSTNDVSADDSVTSVSDMAADSFNPKSPIIGNTRIEGITHFASVPGTGQNIFGGIGIIANSSGEFDSVEDDAAFVFVEIGSGGGRTAGGSRAAALSQFRAALDDAKAYGARYGGPDDGDLLSRRDAKALRAAASGQMPMLVQADRASDLIKLIEVKSDYNLDMIIVGAAEGWAVAEQLKSANMKVMIDPQENLPRSFDAVGSRLDNITRLDAAGVDYAVMTRSADLSHNVRVLSQHAGNAVGEGLSWDKAFAAISSTPARWFNTSSGTLRVDQDATLVVWDGDPLEVTTAAEAVYIGGKAQNMHSRQTALRDRYNPTNTDTRPHKYR